MFLNAMETDHYSNGEQSLGYQMQENDIAAEV